MDEKRPGELVPALIDRPGKYATEDPALKVGDHVKVGFNTSPSSPYAHEWMWLEVTQVEGGYRGELCNRPRFIDSDVLRLGQPVEFRGEHIYSIVHDSPDWPEGEREGPQE